MQPNEEPRTIRFIIIAIIFCTLNCMSIFNHIPTLKTTPTAAEWRES